MEQTAKPGVKTSEFWVNLVALLVSAAVALRWVPAQDAPLLNDLGARAVPQVIALISTVTIAVHYTVQRVKAKQAQAQAQAQEPK